MEKVDRGKILVRYSFLIFLLMLTMSGCARWMLSNIFLNDFIQSGIESLYSETNLQIARTTLEYNISLLSLLSNRYPDDRNYNLYLAQALGFYAFAFVQDESEREAKELYGRGMENALIVLQEKYPIEIGNSNLGVPMKEFRNYLQEMKSEDVPALYWLAYNWGNYLALSLDDPYTPVRLASLKALIDRIIEIDGDYNFGSAYMLRGVYYSSRSPLLGGDPKRALQDFQRCRAIAGDDFLLLDLMMARYYAIQIQDRELFQREVKKILTNTADDERREYGLMNAVARKKARVLKQMIGEYFPEL